AVQPGPAASEVLLQRVEGGIEVPGTVLRASDPDERDLVHAAVDLAVHSCRAHHVVERQQYSLPTSQRGRELVEERASAGCFELELCRATHHCAEGHLPSVDVAFPT